MPKISLRDAIRDALHEEMARDETIFVLGEDVIAHGGPYAVTKGIAEKYPKRIRQTPISEAGIVGTALGAALCGMRPVAEIMYVDFITCAMDEVVNQMAKVRYMFGGQTDVPVVLRLPSGSARLIAAQHSQSLEAWFMHVPGLQVVVPSTPYDAKGLMKTRAAWEGPGHIHRVQAALHHGGGSARRRLHHSVRAGRRQTAGERRDHRGEWSNGWQILRSSRHAGAKWH